MRAWTGAFETGRSCRTTAGARERSTAPAANPQERRLPGMSSALTCQNLELALVRAAVAESGAVQAPVQRWGDLRHLGELGEHPLAVTAERVGDGKASVAVGKLQLA